MRFIPLNLLFFYLKMPQIKSGDRLPRINWEPLAGLAGDDGRERERKERRKQKGERTEEELKRGGRSNPDIAKP